MRGHVFRILLVGCATAAAVALGAAQAFAASTITITGANTGITWTGSLAISDGWSITCGNSVISGSLANVSNAPLPYTTVQNGGTAHSLTAVTLGGCTSSTGSATVSVRGLPWDMVFNAVSTTPPQASGFVRSTGVGGVFFHVSVLTCSFDVAGQADMTWTNGTGGRLNFGGGVHPVNLSTGCFGQPTIMGTFTLPSTTIMIGPGQ